MSDRYMIVWTTPDDPHLSVAIMTIEYHNLPHSDTKPDEIDPLYALVTMMDEQSSHGKHTAIKLP